jgi:3-oxoadipate enol-lactonase
MRTVLLCAIAALIGAANFEAAAAKHNGLYFEIEGNGPAVVLIHGGQMDRRVWDDQFHVFARDYRVIRYDIRGFGKSEAPAKGYSHTDDLKALLQHLRLRHASVIGLSLGAAIAIDMALVHPEMVDGLVLVCPGLSGFSFKDTANDLRAITEAARDDGYAKAAELWLQNPYMSVAMENPALRTKLRQLSTDNARCWLNNPLLLRRLKPPAAERLKEVRAPTLVIGGQRDVSDIHAIVDKLSHEIPGAEKVLLPGAGHIVPMEQPEKFNSLALQFLHTRQKTLSKP